MVVMFRSFALFPGDEKNLENLPDAIIDDWLIQGGLGVLLGAWVLWYFKPPTLWRGWYTDRGLFMWWLLWFLLLMAPQAVFGVKLYDDPHAFPLGPTITIIIIAIVFAFFIQNEPGMTQSWAGRTKFFRMQFWMAVIAMYFSFYYVVQFDFFVGTAPQTWLVWGFWLLVWFVFAMIHGRWSEFIQLLNWQQTYIRRRAQILKERAKILYYKTLAEPPSPSTQP